MLTYFYGVFLNIAISKPTKHTIKVGEQNLLTLFTSVLLKVLGGEPLKTEGFLLVWGGVKRVQSQTLPNQPHFHFVFEFLGWLGWLG